ncbi:MAG TPA: hypothetical protein V6D30_10295 [Leptolyngbyaceae cyanobacterium]
MKRINFISSLIPLLPIHLLKVVFTDSSDPLLDSIAEYHRVGTLIDLVPYLPNALEDVLTAIRSPNFTLFRSEALIHLTETLAKVLNLPEQIIEELFDLAQSIGEDSRKANEIISLIPYLSQPFLEKALIIGRNIRWDSSRAAVLTHLVPYFPNILEEAITVVRTLRYSSVDNVNVQYGDVDKLIQLLPYAPEILEEALVTARSIPKEQGCAFALTKLIPYKPDIVWEAWVIAIDTQDEYYRILALSELIPFCPEALQEAWKGIKSTQDGHTLRNTLSCLAPHLPESMLEEALTIADSIQSNSDRISTFDILAPYLPEHLLEKALLMNRAIRDRYELVEMLVEISSYLPNSSNILTDALSVARRIQDKTFRANALIRLAPHFPEIRQEALNTTRSIPKERDRAISLSKLCSYFPGLIEEAWATAYQIEYIDYQAEVLKDLLPFWTARAEEDRGASNVILKAVSKFFKFSEQNQVRQHLEEVLAVVRSLPSSYNRQKALILVDLLSYDPNLQIEALSAVNSLQDYDGSTKVSSLSKLVPYLPNMLEKALTTARKLPNAQGERTFALSKLIPYLPDLVEEALISVQNIKYEYINASIFKTLAPYLSEELLDKAFAIAHKIQNDSYRASTLATLYACLDPTSISFDSWHKVLQTLIYLERKDFLRTIPSFAPVITSLGTTKAILAVSTTAQKVCRQWA